MQNKIRVVLLGTHASVLSVFRRHRQRYLLIRRESDDISLSIVGQQPHLVVLACDDLHLCQQARRVWPTLPLVIVSENTSEEHIARALDLGADDYVTVPFGDGEFLARIRSLVRRMQARRSGEVQGDSLILTSQDGRIVLRIGEHQCFLVGQEVHLTITEFELLRVLMEHREKILTHRLLLQRVWGPEYGEESDYLRVFVCHLRRKIELDPSRPQYIITEPGVGYVFR